MVPISERIKEAMRARDVKQNELAEKAGVNNGALSCWINGKYTPKQKSIYKLAQALNVSELWLLGDETVPMEKYHQMNIGEALGDERLYREFSRNPPCDEVTTEYDLSDKEVSLVESFRNLDDYGKKTVMVVIESESARCAEQEECLIPMTPEELRKLPLEQRLKFEPYIDDGMLKVARKRKIKTRGDI